MSRGVKRKRRHRDIFVKPCQSTASSPVQHLLEQHYATVQTLRDFLNCKLPSSSRLRRKKIAEIGSDLARVLDSTLICSPIRPPEPDASTKDGEFKEFRSLSQKSDDSGSSLLSNGVSSAIEVQADIVNFVVWLLFKRHKGTVKWPNNILCDGYRKTNREGGPGGTAIPGIFSRFANPQAAALKTYPWPNLLALLGSWGREVMTDLLVNCSVFVAVGESQGNYLQLSGALLPAVTPSNGLRPPRRTPSDITLMRRSVFYSRPALTASGRVRPGLSPFHVLNKCAHVSHPIRSGRGSSRSETEACNELNTARVMMFLFPRQFGLRNVFTPETNNKDQGFSAYSAREAEMASFLERDRIKLPRRLRGAASRLVQRLQVLHGRCSYTETLDHYCPTHLTRRETASGCTRRSRLRRTRQTLALPNQMPLVDVATPACSVSAFCQAVVSKMIPNQFWGDGDTMYHNKKTFLRRVDHFIKLRRFESMTLHEISQGIKVADIAWLRPPGDEGGKLSQTDMRKREEIFHEFLYFTFDSLLIPLIRGCFYVTESNTHFNQVFYFRHDVWRLLSAPALAEFRGNMFEEVEAAEAQRILSSRRLGCGQIRLLPKGGTFRLIMNLRRRKLSKPGAKASGPSINSILKPIHSVFNYEKDANPSRLGSSLMSVGDAYHRLKQFKKMLGPGERRFYFAKVDVHAAFDTIPQAAIAKLMAGVMSQKQYKVKKHVEVQVIKRPASNSSKTAVIKAASRWRATALTVDDERPLSERLRGGSGGPRPHTILIEGMEQTHLAESLESLIAQHVEQNLVRMGKRVFRQSRGIPQGSVLSSFLCNYFYAHLETQHLGFVETQDCLLMRLTDDFLLITLDQAKAVRFVETMHGGLPDYGVEVNQEKSLVSFDMDVDGKPVPRVSDGCGFPYCGLLIDGRSLDITKDTRRSYGAALSNSLTVDFGRTPGHNFQRKMLYNFARRSHPMLYDTSHNSRKAVLQSLKEAFGDVCHRMLAYIRCLPRPKRPSPNLVIETISKMVDVAFRTLSGRLRRLRHPQYAFDIHKKQVLR
ncbi:Telomerase reverse transcriptase [Ophiocordyceps camponoti-floridani]|uniref:Telomerase reverse transcriptase n=1 Tax=Ophiocordyceps camponoti-floridani TaxID=2030778 RepID=A0A8H4Q133_9HYPO|nr:Telomerase reverse transcriptase [Ophiocordyceps camponoti-floridani]